MSKIAILGGGFAGLSASYDLMQKHKITVFEAEDKMGGLSSGFQGDGWEWELERTYHHIFSSDADIVGLLSETGYKNIYFGSPTTSSLYSENGSFRTYPIDNPIDLLLFPKLSPPERIRAGLVLGLLKILPSLKFFEQNTTSDLLSKWMGNRAYETLFGDMLRKKFGKYAGNILASFIWSRIHKRTRSLGYMEGGFQNAINHIAKVCEEGGVQLCKGERVCEIIRKEEGFTIVTNKGGETRTNDFDSIISTLSSPLLASIPNNALSSEEIYKLQQIKYLGATNLILEMDEAVFPKEYWVSLCTQDIPGLVFVQHTNFIDKSHYNNNHILYIGNYCEREDPMFLKSSEEMVKLYAPYIEKIAGRKANILKSYLWKTPYAQPIFDNDFLRNVPQFTTSHKHFYIANLDMTYPYDRGTNFAVKLGRDVAKIINTSLHN